MGFISAGINYLSQQETNDANARIAAMTNAANKHIADQQNLFNYKMFNEQNQWNLERRNEEWAYNSPSAQMQRYLEAGINPLWAMTGGDPGTAQQLTSVSPAPAAGFSAVSPQIQAPQFNLDEVAALQSVLNGYQGFVKLALEAEDVATRRGAQESQAALNLAEGLFKRSQTEGQNIFNRLNSETYSTQVLSKQRELDRLSVEIDNLKKQGKNIDALTENYRATKDQISAQTDFIYQQKQSLIEKTLQGWRQLQISQQQADTAFSSFQSSSFYQGEELRQRYREYQFNKASFEADMKLRSNLQLLQFYHDKRGYLGNALGNLDFTDKIAHAFSDKPSSEQSIERTFEEIMVIGDVLRQRVSSDPSPDNIKSFNEWQRSVSDLPVAPSPLLKGNLKNYSVLNPSVPWQQ